MADGGALRYTGLSIPRRKDNSAMSPSMLPARLHNLRAAIAAHDPPLDALLLSDFSNIGYITGFTGSTAQALVSDSEAVFITDPRYLLRAQEECPLFDIVEASGSGSYGEALHNALIAHPYWKRIGFEAGHVTVAQWRKLEAENPAPVQWTPAENMVETLRLVKDVGEVDTIRQAIAIAEAAFVQIRPFLKAGTTEREIALELEFAMRRGGADGAAFDTIVASGPQGARPHHTPNGRALEPGDFVTVDWGASVGGYNSDITRTVAMGHVSERQQSVYEAVRASQRLAIAAIAPGRNGKEIDAVARDYLTSQELGKAFGHGLGHGLGRHVHDGGGLSVRMESFVLRAGMVLTVEPGVYLEDWGGVRLEEDILVTDGGCEVLTHLPNTLEIVG